MFKKITGIALLALLAACASNPSSQGSASEAKAPAAAVPVVNSTKGYSTVALVVNKAGTDIDADDFKKVSDNLVDAFMSKITVESNLRQATPDKADLKVVVDIKDMHYVSAGKRVMLGILAGHATLSVDAQLLDQKTGAKLWSTSVDTTSSTWAGVYGSSSTSQIETLSQTLDDAVKSNF